MHRQQEPDHTKGVVTDFGMDTRSMAGPLEKKLQAARQAGFSQVILSAREIAGHPGGPEAAVECVRASGLRVAGLQVHRDLHRLCARTQEYEVEIAKSLLEMCAAVGARVLVVNAAGSSTHPGAQAKDLRKLAILAIPMGIRIAYAGAGPTAWETAWRADVPNLGICIDSSQVLADQVPLDELECVDIARVFLVRLSDDTGDEQLPRLPVFPGEGVHGPAVAALVQELHALGWRGDYSFDVHNDDYQQLAAQTVARRAYLSALWLGETVLRRSVPLPNQLRLRRPAPAAREAIPAIES